MPKTKNTGSLPSPAERIAEEAVRRYGAMQKPAELAQLLRILQARPALFGVLEIGGMRGGTAWAWTQIGAKSVVVLDKFVLEGRMERFRPQVLIEGDSHDRAVAKDAARFSPFDFLFIDGDHSYEGVRKDFELYAPLVRVGGVIALHDVSVEQPAWVRPQHDVVPYWNQIRGYFLHREIFETHSEQWGGIGMLLVPSDMTRVMEDIVALGEPTPEDRIATVMCEGDTCHACGAKLQEREEIFCRACAADPANR